MALLKGITHEELWIIAWVICFLCSVGTLWCLLRTVGRATDYSALALVVSGGLFAVSSPVAIWINGGLESPLVMLLLLMSICFLLRRQPFERA